jgi:hypothetical protein
MRRISGATVLAVVGALLLAGCTKSPTSPTGAVSATWPVAVSPTEAAQVPFASQPVRLVVTNAVTAGSTAPTYTFQVASDTGFTNIVFTQSGVAQGSNGQTTLTINNLAGSSTYYWRAHADTDAAGPWSRMRSLAIGPPVVLQTPTLAAPDDGGTSVTPIGLTVNNVQRSGPAGAIMYRVDVSDSSSFGNIVFTTTVPENGGPAGQTSVSVTASLMEGATYYWRAQAVDPSDGITTAYSGTRSFKTLALPLFDPTTAKMWDNPPDTMLWPATAKITSINFTGDAMEVDFDKRTGPNRWPDVPFGSGDIEYTLGMCLDINKQWNCSAVVQFWYGRDLASTAPPANFYYEWWYNAVRWGPMAGYEPAEGEIVGVFVAAGNTRYSGYTEATCPRVCERSNVQLVPFTTGYASYSY